MCRDCKYVCAEALCECLQGFAEAGGGGVLAFGRDSECFSVGEVVLVPPWV